MIPYALLVFTLLFTIVSMLILWRGYAMELIYGWPTLILSLSFAVFIYLYGTWVFISVYLKYVFAAIYAIVLVLAIIRKKNTGNRLRVGVVIINLLLTFIFGTLSVLYFTGTTGKPTGIAHLSLPFRHGRYFVFQGGYGLPTNIFHYGLRGAVYAMDIVKLNTMGNRASSIFSSRLEDYEIFNDTIYSPCSGRVKDASDNNPDNIPPERKRGPTNTNHVLIETDDMYVFMGHFGFRKVFVNNGDNVVAGQPLGLAGNSGFSIEPHLHIQAHTRTGTGKPWYKENPLLITFDGRSYLLFDVIQPKG